MAPVLQVLHCNRTLDIRMPTDNLVDDFFGVSAAKRRRSGSDIMDKTADLVGIGMDPGKSLDSECLMPLLSAEVQTEEANLADDFFEVPAAKR